jgi:hypothetical protein
MFLCPTSLTNINGNIVVTYQPDHSNNLTVNLYKVSLLDASTSYINNAVLLGSSSFAFRTGLPPYNLYPVNISNITLNSSDIFYITIRFQVTTPTSTNFGLIYSLSFS